MKCCRCRKKIIEDKDRWVTIQDWNKGEKVGEKSMHLRCWKNMYKNKLKKGVRNIAPKILKLIPAMVRKTKQSLKEQENEEVYA